VAMRVDLVLVGNFGRATCSPRSRAQAHNIAAKHQTLRLLRRNRIDRRA
jgi:hypothetical protein